jgi:hypothetical protein
MMIIQKASVTSDKGKEMKIILSMWTPIKLYATATLLFMFVHSYQKYFIEHSTGCLFVHWTIGVLMLTSEHKNASYIFSSFSFLGDFFQDNFTVIHFKYSGMLETNNALTLSLYRTLQIALNICSTKEQETFFLLKCTQNLVVQM